eukprot:scaffold3574_cov49-Attheya_sp.AAC.7
MRVSLAIVAFTLCAVLTGADAFGVSSPLVRNNAAFRQGSSRGSVTKVEMAPRNPNPNAGTPIKALFRATGWLGLSGALLGLIITAPFPDGSPSDVTKPQLKISIPKIQMEKVMPEKKAATSKKPSGPSKSD